MVCYASMHPLPKMMHGWCMQLFFESYRVFINVQMRDIACKLLDSLVLEIMIILWNRRRILGCSNFFWIVFPWATCFYQRVIALVKWWKLMRSSCLMPGMQYWKMMIFFWYFQSQSKIHVFESSLLTPKVFVIIYQK